MFEENSVKAAFTVAVLTNGELSFKTFGDQTTLVNLLGLNEYAKICIRQSVNHQTCSGDYRVDEVGKAVALVNSKIDQLLNQENK